MFNTHLYVRLYDTDAAGILYFGNQFRFAHESFEQFLDSEGIYFKHLFDQETFIFVIVHAQSDYLAPLRVGDKLDVSLAVSHIGKTSFEITYTFSKSDTNLLVGRSKTVHVCLNKASHTKEPLPDTILSILKKHILT